MIRRPPRSTLFPTRRSSDLCKLSRFLCSAKSRALAPFASARSSSKRAIEDRKSTRLNSSHLVISYAVFCLKKKKVYIPHTHCHVSHTHLIPSPSHIISSRPL